MVKEENIEILKDKGYVIHLVVDVDEASRRISDKSSRPLFSDLESARARLDERRPAYGRLPMRMCLRAESVHQIALEVKALLEQEGVLCRQPR